MPKNTPKKETWTCLECGKDTNPDKNLTACPNCGSKGIPVSSLDSVTVKISQHELRILCMWAENWADYTDKNELSSLNGRAIITNIANRISKNEEVTSPLTFSGEFKQLKKAYPDAETNFPVDDKAKDGDIK